MWALPVLGGEPEQDAAGKVVRNGWDELYNYRITPGTTARMRLDSNRETIAVEYLPAAPRLSGAAEARILSPPRLPSPAPRACSSPSPLLELEWKKGVFGSGIGKSNICLADVDGDATPEIIVGGCSTIFGADDFWHVVHYDAASNGYQDAWVSDYYPETISRMVIADPDLDGSTEIVLGLGNGSVQIFDASRLELEDAFSTAAGGISELSVFDVDQDGKNEIVVTNGSALYVYDATQHTLEWSNLTGGGKGLAIGNVDADPAVEIVASSSGKQGYVIDGSSRAVTWEYATGFGNIVRTGDIDGDAINEIVGANAWYYVTAFDADSESLKWQIGTSHDIGALRLMDIDGDSATEVLYGDGQGGYIHCLDGRTQAEEWKIANPKHGVTDIGAADVDGDGTTELLWGAGVTSTGEDHLYVSDFSIQSIEWRNEHLDPPFQAFDAGDVDGDGAGEIVMGSYTTNSGSDSGTVLIYDAATHAFEWSSGPLPEAMTWGGLQSIKVADVDQDGAKEYLVGTSDIHSGVILCYRGATRSLMWTSPEYEGVIFCPIAVCDLDGDGQTEVIGGATQESSSAEGASVCVLRGSDGTEEWRSTDLGASWPVLYALRVVDVDNDGHQEIVAGIKNGAIYIFDGVTKALDGQIERADTGGLDACDIDGDGVVEILVGTSGGDLIVYNGISREVKKQSDLGSSSIDAVKVASINSLTYSPLLLLGSGGRLSVIKYSDLSTLWQSPILGETTGYLNNLVCGDIDQDSQCEIVVAGSHALNVYEAPAEKNLNLEQVDFDGDGSSDIALYRGSSGLWSVRNLTRAYFGNSIDRPVPADYNGDGTADIAIFRFSSGLWSVKNISRLYMGGVGDCPIPKDYNGDGSADLGTFRASNGMWAIRNWTRFFFGSTGDTAVPGSYVTSDAINFAIYRGSMGMWSIRNVTKFYFGYTIDRPVPGDYTGLGRWVCSIYRPTSGFWSIRNVTKYYLGNSSDWPLPADYNGDGKDEPGIFRASTGMWSVLNLTRLYFGAASDLTVTR
jgi:hypothetical protein